jgi:hypothetical protein
MKNLPRHLQNWRRVSSGLSVEAGPTRVRMEAAGTPNQRIDIARMIAAAPELFEELAIANRIIMNGLAVMTIEQKAAWSDKNEADGLVADNGGATRNHQRELILAKAVDG